MKTALVLFLVLLSVSLQAYTPPDSCLKLICPNDHDEWTGEGSINPDSVKVDSCLGSPTYEQEYANRYYSCKFPFYIFDSVIPVDSIKTVDSISNSYLTIKQQFQTLDSIYGPIYFIRDYEDARLDWPDSVYSLTGWVFFYLENYQCVDSIVVDFTTIVPSLLLFSYENRVICDLLTVDTENAQNLFISPNPSSDYIEIVDVVGDVKIFDVLGIEHPATAWHPSAEGNVRIDVSSLPNGVYFVQIGAAMYKFVKIY